MSVLVEVAPRSDMGGCEMFKKLLNNEAGIKILDLLLALSLCSIMSGSAIMQLKDLNDSSDSTTDSIVSIIREARAKALTGTQAYTVDMSSATRLRTQSSPKCSSTTKTTDNTLAVQLPVGTSVSNSSWSVCFDSRGFASSSVQIAVTDSRGRSTSFEIVLGGAVRKI